MPKRSKRRNEAIHPYDAAQRRFELRTGTTIPGWLAYEVEEQQRREDWQYQLARASVYLSRTAATYDEAQLREFDEKVASVVRGIAIFGLICFVVWNLGLPANMNEPT